MSRAIKKGGRDTVRVRRRVGSGRPPPRRPRPSPFLSRIASIYRSTGYDSVELMGTTSFALGVPESEFSATFSPCRDDFNLVVEGVHFQAFTCRRVSGPERDAVWFRVGHKPIQV